MSTLKDRRSFLFGGAALLAFASVSSPGVAAAREYNLGRLAGRPATDLYAAYIGWNGRGRLPKRMRIDYDARLGALWTAKLNRSKGNGVVRTTGSKLRAEYRRGSKGTMSLLSYGMIAQHEANFARAKLDWLKVGQLYLAKNGKVNLRKLRLLRNVAYRINGRQLMAYALTELMPGRNDGKFNRDFLDFLLRTAGRAYVERIPAIHDRYTSFGPYQFTSYALYDANGERRGASRVNMALPREHRIPGSVMKLRGNEHFRAAFLFAVHNFGLLIRRLNNKQLSVFEAVWRRSDDSITEFIAVAHHAPALAMKAGVRWLDNRARQPLRRSCSGRGLVYANKTAVNYRALL